MGISRLISGKKRNDCIQEFTSDFAAKRDRYFNFLWIVNSFSKLSMSDESRQSSGNFQSKGSPWKFSGNYLSDDYSWLSWKLVLYPNGNIINDHISLYLMLQPKAPLPTDSMFIVSYKLVLFNQNPDRILSRKEKRFGQVQEKIGFRNFIDLKTFKDSSNGYLLKDGCMIGVKILEAFPVKTMKKCLLPMKKFSYEYKWKIENFSNLNKKPNHWNNIKFGDFPWNIVTYPDADDETDNVSLYINFDKFKHERSAAVSAEFTFSIVDQIRKNQKEIKSGAVVFRFARRGCGWKDFIHLNDFNDPALGFLVNDSCIIKIKVDVLKMVE